MGDSNVEPVFLVAVMHINREPWISIVRDGQIPTWSLQAYNKFEVIYFHGTTNHIYAALNSVIEKMRWKLGRNASYAISYFMMVAFFPWRNSVPTYINSYRDKSGIEEKSIHVKIPDMISTIRWKKMAILEYFVEKSNADYLIITNASSVFNLKRMVHLVTDKHMPGTPIYAGPLHHGYDCIFVSGSFTLLDKTASRKLLDVRKRIPLHVMDDIGFGTAFKKLEINPVEIDSLAISTEEELDRLSIETLNQTCHFRLKSGNPDSRSDTKLSKKLFQRLGNL